MGSQIIKQTLVDGKPVVLDDVECTPGLYAVWSSIVDDFTAYNCTRNELVDYFVEEERRRVIDMVDRKLDDLERDIRKTVFTMTFEEAIRRADEVHGDESNEDDAEG